MDYPKSLAWVGLLLGKFTNGTQDGSVKPSADPAEWANAVTDEILAVITAAGMEPNEANTTQLRDAIEIIIAANMTAGTMPVIGKDAAYVATADDLTKVIEATANTWTLGFDPAATLRDGWWCAVRNAGAGTITLDPNGGERIDGVASVPLAPGASCFVVCDGLGLRTLGRSGSGRSAGDIFWTAAATPPSGSLKANGAAVLRSSYPALEAATYVGDANNATAGFGYRCADNLNPSTTRSVTGAYIVLPNLVDRMPIGAGGLYALSATGGEATHLLTLTEMPAHAHYVANADTGGNASLSASTSLTKVVSGSYGLGGTATVPIIGISSSSGGGAAHNNLPPFTTLLPCIQY